MQLSAHATIVAVRAHGEHGAIVRAVTAEAGLLAGYVRGGRSTRLRPVLQPGNLVLGDWRARSETQLAALTVELVHSRAGLHTAPLPAAALDWVTALAAAALPEGQPYPAIAAALSALLDALEAAPAARGWLAGLARFEALVLRELGYGDAARAAVIGEGGDDVRAALDRTGEGLARHVLSTRPRALDARERMMARLRRMAA